MNIENILFASCMGGMLMALILYVIFGQVTVRKLRKNPDTQHALGIEFASGWDILNVAQALSLPQFLAKKLDNSPISFLYANSELLIKHTSKFDRGLAAIFYWLFTASGFTLIGLVVFNGLGVFE